MIKVVCIDDHAIVRAALRALLQEDKDIQVIGEASTAQEGIALTRALSPDVVTADFMLPDMPGLDLIQRLVHSSPNTKILVLSSITQDLSVLQMFKAGAWGYLSKEAQPEALIRTIKTLFAGHRMIPPSMAARFALSKRNLHSEHAFHTLSQREKEMMQCIIRGMTMDEIAKKFSISHKTVYTLRSRIFQKINVKNDLELTLLAMHYGIVKSSEKTPKD